MRYCPTCATAYPNKTSGTCSKDGSVLVTATQFEAQKNDPLMGTVLGGRYRIVGRVGTGGMGTVYRAEQVGLARAVALKVLKQEFVSDRETVGRFQREANAMSLLMHPNTVRVFDFGEDKGGHLFLAMELLEGELLTAHAEREGPLDPHRAVRIAIQILRSLGEAHLKGLVHRDLKPDNIFLAQVEGHPQAIVKVLDFGIAKIFRDDGKPINQLETQAGTVFGTPRYMSPEQAQGRQLDPRSDLYSVGVLLYQLLVGHAPFVDDDAVVVMAKHIREEVIPPTVAAPQQPIPPRLEAAVMKALGKEPGQRFASAEVFEQALQIAATDIDAERARRRAGGPPLPTHAPKQLWMAVAAGLAVVVLLGAALLGLLLQGGSGVTETSLALEPPPPSVVVQTRRVMVDSRPSGAEIWQLGRQLGTTPFTFDVSPGPQPLVELRLPDHASSSLDLANAREHEIVMLVESMPPIPPPVPEVLPGEAPEGTEGANDERPRIRRRDTPTTPEETATPPETTTTTMQGYQLWQ